jgi:hypothetical protein
MAAFGWKCRFRPQTPHARIIGFCGEIRTLEQPTRNTRADHCTAGNGSKSTTTFLELGPRNCTTAGAIRLASAVRRAVPCLLQCARHVDARSVSSRAPRAPHFASSKVPRRGTMTSAGRVSDLPTHSEVSATHRTANTLHLLRNGKHTAQKGRPHTSSADQVIAFNTHRVFVPLFRASPTDFEIISYIYLTAVGLTPSGSSTVHIYTQTAHRIQRTEHTYIKKLETSITIKIFKTNLGSAGRAPPLRVIP